ncbi:MAG: hypothetical protein JW904_00030 [Spirochaetales bacterium]|nr:hypothetical protein [Spirochaetales bacterium]
METRQERAQIMRKYYALRKKITHGKLKIGLSSAKKLIGPDAAFHLYQYQSFFDDKKQKNN